MTLEIFIIGLTICSAATSLVTEAVKKMFEKSIKQYNSNIIAAFSAVFVAVITIVVYAVFAEITVTPQFVIFGVLFTLFSWIGSMVGYDKIIQTIRQVIGKKED